MSRVRFHSMDAISKVADVTYSGRGWDNYDREKTVQENINYIYGKNKPDIVVGYKPLELKNFKDIDIPKCMRYNEMWDKKWTAKEILESESNIIVCHHLNDMSNYKHIKNVKFVNISHCAEKTIYKDYGEEKTNDVLITGATGKHYPFRSRLIGLVKNKLSKMVKCKILNHPGGDLRNIHGAILENYAREINRSKITLTCSSRYKYRLGKYIEIPMCASLLAADLPDEDQDFFKRFMLVLNTTDSDELIINKIVSFIQDDKARNKLVQRGTSANQEYTQEKYAERFIKEMEIFLGEK